MKRLLRGLLGVLILGSLPFSLILAEAKHPQSETAQKKDPPELKLTPAEQKILDLTNAARAKEKLPPLKVNAILVRIARAHSANMAKQRKMEHDLDGKNPAQRAAAAGYNYAALGENIAFGSKEVPVETVFEGWMKSPGHRQNILQVKYKEIGIGLAPNDQEEIYYTQDFGKQRRGR